MEYQKNRHFGKSSAVLAAFLSLSLILSGPISSFAQSFQATPVGHIPAKSLREALSEDNHDHHDHEHHESFAFGTRHESFFVGTHHPLTEVNETTQNGTANYELKIDQDFHDLRDRIITEDRAAQFTDGALFNLELVILEAYIQQNIADVYDFIAMLPTPEMLNELKYYGRDGSIFGLANGTQFIEGIGLGGFDGGPSPFDIFNQPFEDEFGFFLQDLRSHGKFQGNVLVDIGALLDSFVDVDQIDYTLVHEIGHRWGMFLSSGGDPEDNPLGLLGRGNAHWSSLVNAGYSPLEGIHWSPDPLAPMMGRAERFIMDSFQGADLSMIPDNELTSYEYLQLNDVPNRFEFNDFDLYAMGLLAAGDVNPLQTFHKPFIMEPFTGRKIPLTEENFFAETLFNPIWWTSGDRAIYAEPRQVTIQDIIDIEGPRGPPFQTDFNLGFVTLKGVTASAKLATIQATATRWQTDLPILWNDATRGLSNMAVSFSALDFTNYKNDILNNLNKVNDLTAGEAQNFLDELDEGGTNKADLKALTTIFESGLELAQEFAAEVFGRQGLAGIVGPIVESLLNAFAPFMTSQNFFDSMSYLDAKNLKDGATNLEDFLTNGFVAAEALIDAAEVTGLLPDGFIPFFESLFDAFQIPFADSLRTLLPLLVNANVPFMDFATFETNFTNDATFIEGVIAKKVDFDASILSVLNENQTIEAGGGNFDGPKKPGAILMVEDTSDGFNFDYDVSGRGTTAQVKFNMDPVVLPGSEFIVAMKGPANVWAKVILEDENGKKAEYLLPLETSLKNFKLDLEAGHIEAGFDKDKIESIAYEVQNQMTTRDSGRGNIMVQLPSHKTKRQVGTTLFHEPTHYYYGKGGLLTEQTIKILDDGGSLLYTISREGIKYNKNTMAVDGYKDTLVFPDKTEIRAGFKRGMYGFKSNSEDALGKIKVQKQFAVPAGKLPIIDTKNHMDLDTANFVVRGFGTLIPNTDKYKVVRFTERVDKRSGEPTSWTERVYDVADNLLMGIIRKNTRIAKGGGGIESYQETFIFTDLDDIRGNYRGGIYTLSGRYIADGDEIPVAQSFLLANTKRFLLDSESFEIFNTIDFLIGGGITETVYDKFKVLAFRTQIDPMGRVLSSYERFYDTTTGEFIGEINRRNEGFDGVGNVIEYREDHTFANGEKLRFEFLFDIPSGISGVLVTGSYPELGKGGVIIPFVGFHDRFLYDFDNFFFEKWIAVDPDVIVVYDLTGEIVV